MKRKIKTKDIHADARVPAHGMAVKLSALAAVAPSRRCCVVEFAIVSFDVISTCWPCHVVFITTKRHTTTLLCNIGSGVSPILRCLGEPRTHAPTHPRTHAHHAHTRDSCFRDARPVFPVFLLAFGAARAVADLDDAPSPPRTESPRRLLLLLTPLVRFLPLPPLRFRLEPRPRLPPRPLLNRPSPLLS